MTFPQKASQHIALSMRHVHGARARLENSANQALPVGMVTEYKPPFVSAASASPSGFGAARKPIPRCRTEGDALRMAMAEGYDVNDVEHGGADCVVS